MIDTLGCPLKSPSRTIMKIVIGWFLAFVFQQTFHYSSEFWSNNQTFNFAGGEGEFDSNETKLPTYWNTPFTKICLGMKIGQQINFIVINKTARSLHSLIADEQYRSTTLGRDTWKTLVGADAHIQPHCNMEGFNSACDAVSKQESDSLVIMKTIA